MNSEQIIEILEQIGYREIRSSGGETTFMEPDGVWLITVEDDEITVWDDQIDYVSISAHVDDFPDQQAFENWLGQAENEIISKSEE